MSQITLAQRFYLGAVAALAVWVGIWCYFVPSHVQIGHPMAFAAVVRYLPRCHVSLWCCFYGNLYVRAPVGRYSRDHADDRDVDGRAADHLALLSAGI